MSIAFEPGVEEVAALDYEPPEYEMLNGIHYPSSDGVEMGEGDWHFTALTTLFGMLREHYFERDAYVAGDMMLYYEEGNPKAVRAPDVMVCLDVKNFARSSWFTWVEGAVPAVVFEIASPSTKGQDLGAKRTLYERLGVTEYFAFDPVGDVLGERRGRLRGWRLIGGKYQDIRPDEVGNLRSECMGLLIYAENSILRLVDLESNRPLKTYHESEVCYQDETGRLKELHRRRMRKLRRENRRSALEAEAQAAKAREEFAAQAAEIERLKALLKP